MTSLRFTRVPLGALVPGLSAVFCLSLAACSGSGSSAPPDGGGPGAETPLPAAWLEASGGEPGIDGLGQVLLAHDDGQGMGLWLGGNFGHVGGWSAGGLGLWRDGDWTGHFAGGASGAKVTALASFDEGGGPRLFAAGVGLAAEGSAGAHLARLDGQGWSAVGGGLDGPAAALWVHDDGRGSAIFAGGAFLRVGGLEALHVARWDGVQWSALGAGFDQPVTALVSYDGGAGPLLVAGGAMGASGAVSLANIAAWDGFAWSSLGAGLDGPVRALAVFDDGAGPALIAGGDFGAAGSVPAAGVARWDGRQWSALGAGLGDGPVHALAVFDGGQGPELFAAGEFLSSGEEDLRYLARFDGQAWSAVGGGLGAAARALRVFDDGTGPALYAAGAFLRAGETPVKRVARWDGRDWTALGRGFDDTLTAFAAGGGAAWPGIFVGGFFRGVDGRPADRVARWDGEAWDDLGRPGFNGAVRAFAFHESDGGPVLVAAGAFDAAGGSPGDRVALYDGETWSSLGAGLGFPGAAALASVAEGPAAGLYAGGRFGLAGGQPAHNIARWSGGAWSALGEGTDDWVLALEVVDGVGGQELIVGGSFQTAGGAAAARIARFDGENWSNLASGMNDAVRALVLHAEGAEPRLFAGGDFTVAGGLLAGGVARWDGSAWTPLGAGVGGRVSALFSHDDGAGSALFAAGDFLLAGGGSAARVARWDGEAWTSLAAGMSAPVFALGAFAGEIGEDLFLGGMHLTSPAGDSYGARWGRAMASAAAFAGGPVVLEAGPCALEVALEGKGEIELGEGELRLAAGARVAPAPGLRWISGTLVLEGGSWRQEEPLVFGFDGPARLVLAGGARLDVPRLVLGPLGEWCGEGSLTGELESYGRVEPSGRGLQIGGRARVDGAVLEGPAPLLLSPMD